MELRQEEAPSSDQAASGTSPSRRTWSPRRPSVRDLHEYVSARPYEPLSISQSLSMPDLSSIPDRGPYVETM